MGILVIWEILGTLGIWNFGKLMYYRSSNNINVNINIDINIYIDVNIVYNIPTFPQQHLSGYCLGDSNKSWIKFVTPPSPKRAMYLIKLSGM